MNGFWGIDRWRASSSAVNVLALAGPVALGQQNDRLFVSFRVAHAVDRTRVDLEFSEAPGQLPVLPWMAVHQPIHPHQNSSSSGLVAKCVDPVPNRFQSVARA